MSDLGDIAETAAAAFAAVAAGASWRTVRQADRSWRRQEEPNIVLQVHHDTSDDTVAFTFGNVGGGNARGVLFVAATPAGKVEGIHEDGILRPGVDLWIRTDLPWHDDAEAVVVWRNPDESAYAIDRVGPRERLRRPHRRRRQRVRYKPFTVDDGWAAYDLTPPLDGLPTRKYVVGVRSG